MTIRTPANADILAALVGVAIMCGATGSDIRAQESTVTAPIVVTASRLPGLTANATGATTVISRAQIEAWRATSTIELLRRVPGLHIDQPGGRGGVSSVYLRGSDPNFTLVMIDGVRVNDPTNSRGGSFDFATLDPGSIERIEVIRGPLSSIYGSDAIAGAINIITREGTPQPVAAAQVEDGRFGYYRGWAELRGPLELGDFAVSASVVDDGDPVAGSLFMGKTATASVTLVPMASTVLRLSSRFADSLAKSFPDDSGGPLFAVPIGLDKRDSRDVIFAAEITYEAGRDSSYVAKASYYDRAEVFFSPGVAPGIRDPAGIVANSSDSRFRRETVTGYGFFSPLDGLAISAGAEAVFEQGASDSQLIIAGTAVPGRFGLARQTYAPFAEVRISLPLGLMLEGGGRLDIPDAFDAEFSPRIGLSRHFENTGTSLSASWGEGFKLPSFFALGHPFVGNGSLRPETSESAEIGIEQDLWSGQAALRAALFYNRFFDLIDFDEGPPPQLVNRSEVTSRGFELAGDVRPSSNLTLGAHMSYTRTDIEGTAEELRNRPQWRSGADVLWHPRGDVTVALDGFYVGEILDSSIATGDRTLDGYFRVDLTVTWTPLPDVELSLAVDNLLDADFEEAAGFPGVGIRPRLIARVTF
jgi:vitamin B12 transporter